MKTNKIEVSKDGAGKTVYIPLSVYRAGEHSLTISYDAELMKVRGQTAVQRRTLGYFAERKFAAPGVVEALAKYGFEPKGYQKVIVSWGWEKAVEAEAEAKGIQLWHFADLLNIIAKTFKKTKSYFTDDTLRTLQLFAMATKNE